VNRGCIKVKVIQDPMSEAITSIPLFLEDQDDIVIWNAELHGKYTVGRATYL
jgi:hypothetical protein